MVDHPTLKRPARETAVSEKTSIGRRTHKNTQKLTQKSRVSVFLGSTGVPAAFLAIAVLLVYSNSMRGVFVFDDIPRILESDVVRLPGWTWERFRGLFLYARPLSDLTLRLNFQFSQFNTWSYHLFNIAVHLLSALVLMALARICFRLVGTDQSHSRAMSFAVALLWALHPLQTQAVTYVYQRAESLGGLFLLLTVYCAASGLSSIQDETRRNRWFSGSVAACAIGHLCKQTLFTAPLAVLAFDYCFIGGSLWSILRRSWRLYLGLGLTWFIGAGLILATSMDETVGYSMKRVTMLGYLLSQPGVILHYLRLSLWPDTLLLNYNWPAARSIQSILPPLLVIAGLLAAVLYALRRPEKRWRAFGFLGAWFFITLAMSSSFFPIKDLAFEHRMYLALASVVALFAVALNRLIKGDKARLVLVLALAVALGVRTYLRNADYGSPYTIWGGVLAAVPDDPRATNELGNAYRDDGRFSDALAFYEKAIRIDPDNPGPHLNAGFMQARLGNLEMAEWHYREALRKKPSYPDAHLNLGNVLVSQGRQEEALEHYDMALRQKPVFFEALMARANTLCTLNRFQEALEYYVRAMRSHPDRFEVYSDMGTAFFKMARYEEALRFYYEALRRQPDAAILHLSAANTLRKLGRDEEANRHESRAKELMLLHPQPGTNNLVAPGFGPK
ncbi:MAG TPA: tetratricopeptide repeat protein [Acidobacteriota bacterium]|nr:tetratricopeptide repeat protein [Acidobacteriota bacterium]